MVKRPIQSVVRLLVVVMTMAVAAISMAEGVIRLQSYPQMTVADGRSTTTISAEVRDRGGKLVPNGTQVVFTTNLGSFNDPVAKTTNGIARVVFTSGSVSGTARIQASALSFGAVSVVDVELVADRSMLSTAKEYIEVVGTNDLFYNVDDKVIGASGANHGVSLRYRDVEIEADDLQVTVPSYEVRARRAILRIGTQVEQEFSELYFRLNQRTGYGTTTVDVPNYEIVGHANMFGFKKTMKRAFGLAKVTRNGVESTKDPVPGNAFEFIDVLDATSSIAAKKAIAFPKGSIQFHKAELYVGANRVMKMPLYQHNMYGTSSMVTDQVVNVYDNRLSVNYPHYLSLKPGETSLFRLRTGERYGRSMTGSGGVFVDYELNWNRGDDMDGGLVVSGLTRKDWSLGARQYLRLGANTVATAQVDFPAHSSIYGTASLNHQMGDYQFNMSANNSRSIRGHRYESSQYMAVVERNAPVRLGGPFSMFYGLSANSSSTITESMVPVGSGSQLVKNTIEQESVALRSRLQMAPIKIGGGANITGSMLLSKQYGTNVARGLSTLADVSLSVPFSSGSGALISYNYSKDGYMDRLTGMHSLNVNGYYDGGRSSLSATLSRSLDIDRFSYFVDASYRISGVWRTTYSLTLDQYLGERYLEDSFMLSYRIGVREIGVSYSIRDKRFGFQVFGAQFN